MEIFPDFKELLALFNAKHVEYLVVGGYALAFHGAPRFTGDLDLYVRPTLDNADRVLSALSDFGFAELDLNQKDFQDPQRTVQLGYPPIRVDLITSIDGVSWEQADRGKTGGDYGGVPVHFLGRREFILNKRATGRNKDLADIDAIGEGEKQV